MITNEIRISTTKLVEYMESSALQRSNIIEEIAFPTEFKPYVLWYKEYTPAFKQYLISQDFDASFNSLKISLSARYSGLTSDDSDQAEQKILKVLDAISLTSKIEIFQMADGVTFYDLPKELRDLHIGGLIVRSGATNIAQKIVGDNFLVGAVLPYLRSTKPLSSNAATLHGVLLHWLVETNLADYGIPTQKLCLVADLFSSGTFPAGKSFKKIRKDIQANCSEIINLVQARRAVSSAELVDDTISTIANL